MIQTTSLAPHLTGRENAVQKAKKVVIRPSASPSDAETLAELLEKQPGYFH
ncbi:hypothetical protein [Deinococcus terrestris]|uniref:hypothetical protein n=1 Tax=Deinococcus terrestris TaxID=2651870 RepID=UPI0018833FA5|nr:hypothetical protein [Deinococcus terrestris]